MVAFDSGFLGLLLHKEAKPPNDPATGSPTLRAAERIDNLVEVLDSSRERILIPTPALSEFLVLAGDEASEYINELTSHRAFILQAFDTVAAIELAAMENLARKRGSKRFPAQEDASWQKVKFDRQIVATAKVHQAHTIYSNDTHVRAIGEDYGIKVVPCWRLELPESNAPLFDKLDDLPPEIIES